MSDPFPFRVFEPEEEVLVVERKLPHWAQPGTIALVTFRTWDSMPARVIQQWLSERSDWLRGHGLDAAAPNWKEQFTATQINRQLNRKGRFWQQDGFDHLVRSVEQFEYLRGYVAQNPIKAKLHAGEYLHKSKVL